MGLKFPYEAHCRTCKSTYTRHRYHEHCPHCHEGRECKGCGELFYPTTLELAHCWQCVRVKQSGGVLPIRKPRDPRKKPRVVIMTNFFEERGSQEERERRAALWERLQAKRGR